MAPRWGPGEVEKARQKPGLFEIDLPVPPRLTLNDVTVHIEVAVNIFVVTCESGLVLPIVAQLG